MRLEQLLAQARGVVLAVGGPVRPPGASGPDASDGVVVASLCHDSRDALPGSLFFCLKGANADGHDFALDAVRRGAVAVVCERQMELDVPQVLVAPGGARAAMAEIAAAYYGRPAEKLRMVGVTGTNGKTTVTHLLKSVFEFHGWPTAVLGTLGGTRTTPEADVVHRVLAAEVAKQKVSVAMEVSSHALVQGRVEGLAFAAAVFTNLTHEHLDYHKSMESYFDAKSVLFTPRMSAIGVVNRDDPWGRRLISRAEIPIVTYGLDDASGVKATLAATEFTWRGMQVSLGMPASFNVENALAAATVASALGVPERDIAAGLSSAPAVAGRFEVIDESQPFAAIVDYAHTPAGLERSAASARELAAGRLILVFGCGGDRDTSKRKVMGEIASRIADVVILTSDNPRSEDPAAIISEVSEGVSGSCELLIDQDRLAAIERAVSIALPGDIVVVAGRGHEKTQEIGGRSIPFDDSQVLREALRRNGVERG